MATTTLRAASSVSRWPKLPIAGVATIQSDESFGHAVEAGVPAALKA